MTYDFIFTGAGCAGLSLVYRMSQDKFFDDKSILLIDSAPKNQNDRTWCFWSTQEMDFPSIPHRNWSSLQFKSTTTQQTSSIAPYRYHHLKGIDFYLAIKKEICRKENITWCQDEIVAMDADEQYAYVKTKSFVYKASIVFNSIMTLTKERFEPAQLFQHFFGYTIKTKKETFDKEHVTLMDFTLSSNQENVQFGYIIPFSPHEALVEFTEFSDRTLPNEAYRAELIHYLEQKGITDYEIIEEEWGRIPMVVNDWHRQQQKMVNIGTAGGMTKPTTGYTFRNIQRDSERLIEDLKKGILQPRARSRARFSFYDRLLLGIIQDEPRVVHKIMSRLFAKNKMTHILKFLDEETNILEEIRIFFSIPWAPFLRQLTKR